MEFEVFLHFFFVISVISLMISCSLILIREARCHSETSAFYEGLCRDQGRMSKD